MLSCNYIQHTSMTHTSSTGVADIWFSNPKRWKWLSSTKLIARLTVARLWKSHSWVVPLTRRRTLRAWACVRQVETGRAGGFRKDWSLSLIQLGLPKALGWHPGISSSTKPTSGSFCGVYFVSVCVCVCARVWPCPYQVCSRLDVNTDLPDCFRIDVRTNLDKSVWHEQRSKFLL